MDVLAQTGKYPGVDYTLNRMEIIKNFILQAVQLLELHNSLILGHIHCTKHQLFNIICAY
jgi:hypothetical protein